MQKETLTLSQQQITRFEILSKSLHGTLSISKAAVLLGLSTRQVKRLRKQIKRQGLRGLLHGNQGRAPKNKKPPALRQKVLTFARSKYKAFNVNHLVEKLTEVHHLPVTYTWTRRLLIAEGLRHPSRRHRPHRSRRDRMPAEGLMLLMDGSPHPWVKGKTWTLLGAIDDATSKVPAALFAPSENTRHYLLVLKQILLTCGIPASVYVDRHSVFYTTRHEGIHYQVKGGEYPLTQMARALTELGTRIIYANSPQAKGRIERLWGTFQQRLIPEMSLAKVQDRPQANHFLRTHFLPDYHKRFTQSPIDPKAAWRPIPKDLDLDRILCHKETRTVAADNTISWYGKTLQIPPHPTRLSFAKAQVEICGQLDGPLYVYYKELRIAVFKDFFPLKEDDLFPWG